MPVPKTLSPDAGLALDISISDLGSLIGGESPAAPVLPAAASAPPEPAAPEPKPPEAAAAEPSAAEPEPKPEAQATSAEPVQEPTEGKDTKGWADKRLSQMASKRREAEVARREAEAKLTTERDRAERAERELEALRAQPGPSAPAAEPKEPPKPAATADAKPILKDFVAALKDGEEYDDAVQRHTEALMDWRERQVTATQQQQRQQQADDTQRQTFLKDWEGALVAHPDFEDVVDRVRAVAPEGLQVALSQLRQDDGTAIWPEMAIYLDANPDILAALSTQYAQNPLAAATKLGRLAAALAPSAPKPAVQTLKAAPKPPAVVGGNAAPGVVDLEKADMNTFAREVVKLGLEF